ncbi:MAG: hypothetical protein ACRCXK_11280 [Wohlfahrtiimonas sp.]
MDKQEKIVCAAIQFRPYICEHDGFGDKTELNGCSYDEIRSSFAYEYLCVTGSSSGEKEGFMTSKGRFVEPIEAQQIAIACGQYRDPSARIKSLERSIEVGWDSVKYAKNSIMISSIKKRIAEDQATLEALKAGYLGNALRVEDLHYV